MTMKKLISSRDRFTEYWLQYMFIRTVDTDVFVILIGKFHYLLRLNVSAEIRVVFGSGKN